MKWPWWVSLIALALGGFGTFIGLSGLLEAEHRANLHWADSVAVVRSRDSAAAADRDRAHSAQLLAIQLRIDSAAAKAHRDSASSVAAATKEKAARADRDAAIAAVQLTAQQLDRVKAAIAGADSAHDRTIAAKDDEIRTVKQQLAEQVRKSAELQAQVDDARSDLVRQRLDYAALEARFRDQKPAGISIKVGGWKGLALAALGGFGLATIASH